MLLAYYCTFASQSLAILPDWVRSQPTRLSVPTSTYHLVVCLVGTGSAVLVDQTTDGSIRFIATPASCLDVMEISHSSWPWHRSDATALASYANMIMIMMIVPLLRIKIMIQVRCSYPLPCASIMRFPGAWSLVTDVFGSATASRHGKPSICRTRAERTSIIVSVYPISWRYLQEQTRWLLSNVLRTTSCIKYSVH